jgi:hypothetical protein
MRNENLIDGCVRVLEQGLALLERIDDSLYMGTGGLPLHSGVGGHIRHCVDFYQSFLAGLPSGRIDYDRRERDELAERDRAFAATKLRIIISELQSLPRDAGETCVLVSLEAETDESNESDDSSRWCGSTIVRELQFLLSHTAHHYALVALTLRLRGFEPGEEFGVAPSTLKHWRREEEETAVCVL